MDLVFGWIFALLGRGIASVALFEPELEEESLRPIQWIVQFVDRVNEGLGVGVSWLSTLLVLVVCYDVFTRYLLESSSVAVQELEWHLFAFIFLLGAAYTLKHDRHVRVDVFYTRFSRRRKAWVNLVGSLLFLLPLCGVAIWASITFAIRAYAIGETSPDPGGLPARFVLKSAIPIGFFFLLLQGIALALRSWIQVMGKEEEATNA